MTRATYGREHVVEVKFSVDVELLMRTRYGVQPGLANEDYARYPCVVHGGENPTSLVHNKRTQVLHCYSCGFVGDVIQLVREKERASFKEAVDILSQYANGVVRGVNLERRTQLPPHLKALHSAYGSIGANEVLPNTRLVERAKQYNPNPYVASGRFSQSTMEYFEVGYCDFNEAFMNRAIIPIHDEFGGLVGYSGRLMVGDGFQKYRIKKGFKKAYCLYNLHRAKAHLKDFPLVLTEGFGQVWRLHEAGIPTGVALMGKELSTRQADLALQHTTRVVLALDFDAAGVDATTKIIKRLAGVVDVEVLFEDCPLDLGDMTPEAVRTLYEQRVPASTWSAQVR